MEVRLLRVTRDGESLIEYASSVSSQRKLSIETIVENDYSSVLEHIYFTFEIRGISIAASRELLEHRIASHTARSTRYCNEEDFDFYEPALSDDVALIYREAMEKARYYYKMLREKGVPREKARYVLPIATHSHYIWTINARSLINFLSLRLCIRASDEMRELASQIYAICRAEYPRIFERIYCRGWTLGICPENDARPEECPFKKIMTKSEIKMRAGIDQARNSDKMDDERRDG